MANPFNDISDILNRLTDGSGSNGNMGNPQTIFFYKDGRIGSGLAANPVGGQFTSLWQFNGCPTGPSTSAPAGAEICHNLTTGSMQVVNPAVGKNYLLGMDASSLAAGTLVLYDRLADIGSLSGIVITPQTVSQSISRYSGSVTSQGNQIFLEIYSAVGATMVTVNATYLNQNGQTSTTPSMSFGGTGLREAERMIQLPLASGDTGVTAVNSVILSATTATAGNFGVTIARPIMSLNLPNIAVAGVRDTVAGIPVTPQIETDSCLALMWLPNGNTIPQMYGTLYIIEK